MPRPRLHLLCYAANYGQTVIGPYDDPNRVETEAWAWLRERCTAYGFDRATLTPVREYHPSGGLTLKVITADHRVAPAAYLTIHAYLGQEGTEFGR